MNKIASTVLAGGVVLALAASQAHGQACGLFPELLCLAGRTGTANDPTISSDADGTIRGSGASGFALHLGSDDGTPGLHVQRNGLGVDRLIIGEGGDPTTAVMSGGVLQFLVATESEQENIGALIGGLSANETPGASPTFFGIRTRGTLASPSPTEADDLLVVVTAVGVDTNGEYTFEKPPARFGVHQVGEPQDGYVAGAIGFNVTDLAGDSGTRFYIDGNGNVIVHPSVNTGAFATTTSCGLELQGTEHAFVPSRMTTDERNALVATAGMLIFNTDTLKHEGYDGTTWHAFY